MNLLEITPKQFRRAAVVKERIARLQSRLSDLVSDQAAPGPRMQRTLEQRLRMARAQRKSWARRRALA